MARKSAPKIDEKALTKGELRKLNALRKSVGDDIGDQTFLNWLRKKPVVMTELEDKNAALIADTLVPLIEQNNSEFRVVATSSFAVAVVSSWYALARADLWDPKLERSLAMSEDMDGRAVWHRIERVIDELQRTAPGG